MLDVQLTIGKRCADAADVLDIGERLESTLEILVLHEKRIGAMKSRVIQRAPSEINAAVVEPVILRIEPMLVRRGTKFLELFVLIFRDFERSLVEGILVLPRVRVVNLAGAGRRPVLLRRKAIADALTAIIHCVIDVACGRCSALQQRGSWRRNVNCHAISFVHETLLFRLVLVGDKQFCRHRREMHWWVKQLHTQAVPARREVLAPCHRQLLVVPLRIGQTCRFE
ncbi:hypothetical protein D3C81_1033960 [compost metagenome]